MSICGGLCMLGCRALGEVSLSTVFPNWKAVCSCELCHSALYIWEPKSSQTFISCLWVCYGERAAPSLQDPHRNDLGAISPNQTWSLLRAGSCSPAFLCGYGRQRICHRVWWPCLQCRVPRMPHVFSGWGAVHHQWPAKRDDGVRVRWDCWGVCWWAWWGRSPHATTWLFWAMDWAAELDLSQLHPIFCPYRNISQTLTFCPSKCHVSERPLCFPIWVQCIYFCPSSNLRAVGWWLKVFEHFASLHWEKDGCLAGQRVFCLLIDLFFTKARWISVTFGQMQVGTLLAAI